MLHDGVAHLTLEAAASEAGISKGGILYHSPRRPRWSPPWSSGSARWFDADLERGRPRVGPGAFTRAYLEVTFGPPS